MESEEVLISINSGEDVEIPFSVLWWRHALLPPALPATLVEAKEAVVKKGWLEPFLQKPLDPPFLLTSAFPFVGGVRFYPMPVDLRRLFATLETGKRIKRISHLSEGLLRRALNGEVLDRWLPSDEMADQNHESRHHDAGLLLQESHLWLDGESESARLPQWMQIDPASRRPRPRSAYPLLEVWKEGRTPRVTVDRISSASTIFHIGHVRFAEECGLWFGVQWRQPERFIAGTSTTYAESVAAILEFLQDEGLGGDRSVGYGTFALEIAPESVVLPDAAPGSLAWLLSRFHPCTSTEIAVLQAEGVAYHLVDVAGWLRSPDGPAQRRRRIYLLTEGSSIVAGDGVLGNLVDVTPEYANPSGVLPHRVYRAGFGLTVGRLSASTAKEATHG